MNKSYTFDLIDAEDGSGDLILQFTEEFLADQKWIVGDVIEFTTLENTSMMLTNKTLKVRDESID